MKLTIYLFVFISSSLFAQTHTIEIHSNNRVASLLMTPNEYSQWTDNDGFCTETPRTELFQDIYKKFDDDFDFIALVLNEEARPASLDYAGKLYKLSNNEKGLGIPEYSINDQYGSSGKLKSVLQLTQKDFITNGPFLHELTHNWANQGFETVRSTASFTNDSNNFKTSTGHWGFTGGSNRGQLGGFDQKTLVENGGNNYTVERFGSFANGGNTVPYNELELYLMGMIPVTDVAPFDLFSDLNSYSNNNDGTYSFNASTRTTYTPNTIETKLGGPRIPSSATSQKEFKMLIIVLTDTPLTTAEWNQYDLESEKFGRKGDNGDDTFFNFWEATNGIGSIETGNILPNSTLSTTSFELENDLKIYPIPAHSNLYIENSNSFKDINMTLHSVTGKILRTYTPNENTKLLDIDVSTYKAGIYYLNFKQGTKFILSKKILIN